MHSDKHTDARKRHCMIVHAYYPLGETRVQREAEALLKHAYEVDVICLRKKGETSVDHFKGVRMYRLPVRRHRGSGLAVQFSEYLIFFLLAMVTVSWLHYVRRYSTIQVHNPPDLLIFAAWLPKLLGIRLILDLHDLMPEFYSGRFDQDADSLPVRLVRLQERLACRFAHHVITVSHHWQQALIERGVPATKISVVMNLADDRVFHPFSPEDAPFRNDDRFRLFYHGYMPKRYGLDLVLEAMDRLRLQIPEIHLTLVGGGEHLETLKRMADDLNLNENHVEFIPSVPVEQLPPLIAVADVGVVPYRDDVFTDSLLPTKLMEYAVMGLPVIVARTSAISAYFDETMVQFFAPNDAEDLTRCILTLCSDRKRVAQLAQGIKKFNQRYNWTKTSAEYVALVERLGTR